MSTLVYVVAFLCRVQIFLLTYLFTFLLFQNPLGCYSIGKNCAYLVENIVYYHLAANGFIITGDELYMIHKT